MRKFYIIYCSLITILFAYASTQGWIVADSFRNGTWSPKGYSTSSFNHK